MANICKIKIFLYIHFSYHKEHLGSTEYACSNINNDLSLNFKMNLSVFIDMVWSSDNCLLLIFEFVFIHIKYIYIYIILHCNNNCFKKYGLNKVIYLK